MTEFYQLETDFRTVNCGMSYVLKLDNGSVFIIDGGYFTDGQAEDLHRFLEGICPGEIHIRGWFFSHAHQDHIGAFINFIRLYPEVKIDELFYAFQPMNFDGVTGDWKSSDPATFKEFYVACAELPADVKHHILKTGERFEIDEAAFDVLYTYEDADCVITNFNDNSAVLMLTCKGSKIFLPGDIADVGSRALMKHPELLKCDIVQVSHHGFNGATPEVYQAAAAHTVLWPAPQYEMDRNASRPANSWLLNESGADIIIAADGTAKLTLPYTRGTSEVLPRVFPDKVF